LSEFEPRSSSRSLATVRTTPYRLLKKMKKKEKEEKKNEKKE
jgi:hypothetical protein